MYESNWSFNIHPSGIWTFEDWLVQIPSPRGKTAVQMPHLLVHWKYTSPQRQILSSIKHYSRFSEVKCRNDIFKLLLKALLRDLFTNKGEILSINTSYPAKTKKKKTNTRIMLEQEINLVQISHPSKATFKFSPPRARCIVKCPGYARGEDVEASIWLVHYCGKENTVSEGNSTFAAKWWERAKINRWVITANTLLFAL